MQKTRHTSWYHGTNNNQKILHLHENVSKYDTAALKYVLLDN